MANFLYEDETHQLLLSKAVVSFKTEPKSDGLGQHQQWDEINNSAGEENGVEGER